jgi:agmatine/peptidylarginine deiminase
VRPVPEFARVARVVLPAGLFEFNYHADQLAGAVRAAGAQVEIAGTAESMDDSSVVTVDAAHTNIWLRDYSPLPVIKGTRSYLHGFDYASRDQANNDFAARLAGVLGIGFEASGLSLEGGNFLTDGSRCYIAGPIDERDTKVPVPSLEEARRHLGCQDLIVVDNPPHVHIDMFAKILSVDTVAVNELDEAALDLIREPDGDIPDDIVILKDALDKAARQLGQYLKVVRIPMPLPFKNTFRTYANAILVNGTAIIPAYEQYGWGYGSYPDASVLSSIQERAAEVYRQHGYRTTFVNADGLIYNGGAFHCVSAHIPESVLTISDKGKN